MTRTNYIFIDFENVHETDWERIAGKPARVTLVMGEQHKYIPVSVVRKMLKCADQIELIETKRTGKNAADFVLAQLIGAQKKSDPHGYFHVVSNDKGFDALIEHLKENGILAARRASFSDIPVLMNTAERVKSLTAFFTEHPKNRPAKQQTLETQIQAIFGKVLSPEEVAATVQGLIVTKVISVSEAHGVSYPI
jgi:phosphoenolpyruvate carboxylase